MLPRGSLRSNYGILIHGLLESDLLIPLKVLVYLLLHYIYIYVYVYIYVFVSVLHTYTYPTPVPKALLSSLFQCYLKGNHVPEARGRDMGMSQYSEMEWALSLCI